MNSNNATHDWNELRQLQNRDFFAGPGNRYTNTDPAYNRIIPRLYQGCAPTYDTKKFDLVVLCAAEHQNPVEFGLPDHKVIGAPMWDGGMPTRPEDWVRARDLASDIAKFYKKGNTILVTCQMGWNRSGLVTSLAVRKILGVDGKTAVSMVQKAREGALSNSFFAGDVSKLLTPAEENKQKKGRK